MRAIFFVFVRFLDAIGIIYCVRYSLMLCWMFIFERVGRNYAHFHDSWICFGFLGKFFVKKLGKYEMSLMDEKMSNFEQKFKMLIF